MSAALLAVLCALICGPVRARGGWLAVAAALGWLSMDETVLLHERLLGPVGDAMVGRDAQGLMHFSWVVPALALVVLTLAVSARSLLALPRRTLTRLCVAGALYVGGAAGLEMVSGVVLDSGLSHAVYLAVSSVEEGAEMLGVILVIAALTDIVHIARESGQLTLGLRY